MRFEEIRERAARAWAGFENPKAPLVLVGAGTCGRAAGADELLAAVESWKKASAPDAAVHEVGCLGICYAEPMVELAGPGGPRVLYGDLTAEKLAELLEDFFGRGEPRADLALATTDGKKLAGVPAFSELGMLRGQVRIVCRNCGVIDPENIDHYVARGGYAGLARALEMKPEDVVEEVKKSGLRGRGGAGFPTGLKWDFCRKAPGETKYMVCNADEGDPGAFMDREVLESDPHTVLEGMAVAAYAIGAEHGYVYARAEYPLAVGRLGRAIAKAEELGLLGENILGSGFSFHVRVKQGAGAFVCGEETALLASIEGRRGMPRPRPPFPAQRGLFGKPTNINNVETLANVPVILEKGAEWFAQYGTEQSRGTKTFALAGKIERTGLIEVPLGTVLGDVVNEIGGGVPDGRAFKAVQTGGPSGGCIPAGQLDLPVDYEHLAAAGSIMGSGGMVVMDERTCMVDIARYFLEFTQNESCGKCSPCRLGTKQMLRILERICGGQGRPEDMGMLEGIGAGVK
ncbi:MAG: NADH-ubiquinone oxidoreductase-F iron-sulfur binding region domain-containing protein, partial [Planctomycetota bacterium]